MPTVRVLVVDDEDFNRQTLRYCLEPVGFEASLLFPASVNTTNRWSQLGQVILAPLPLILSGLSR